MSSLFFFKLATTCAKRSIEERHARQGVSGESQRELGAARPCHLAKKKTQDKTLGYVLVIKSLVQQIIHHAFNDSWRVVKDGQAAGVSESPSKTLIATVLLDCSRRGGGDS